MTSLFEPFALRPGVESRNRLWLAPLTNQQSHADGTLSDDELGFLAARADGGFGVVETCAAYVATDGKAWPGELGVHDDAMLPGMRRLATRLREGGAVSCVQLFHGGLRATPEVSGLPTWSASAYAEGELPVPRAATEDDLRGVIEAFARAAKRCAEAGFDAVELHGAHGYLFSQFLSSVYNTRTDAWGGTFENRARLLREAVAAVKLAAPSLALVVRMSPEDFGQAKGLDLDESLQLARWLVDDGVDVLHLSLWRAALPTTKRPEAHPLPLFREVAGERVKLVSAGGIWTREDAEAQLALGADAVAVGRAAIVDPRWPERMRASEEPHRPPRTPAQLREAALSEVFVGYMRRWKGFVAD
ncbi:MAG: NADH:flavin oxidoreductase [Sandaracinus sp.]|nr:NADH:flavin oxidoreductase [Sandaracinus sp.]